MCYTILQRCYSVLMAALVALSLLVSPLLFAGNFTMGSYDLNGSRAIPSSAEPDLSLRDVKKKGLEVKWHTQTDAPVIGVPIVHGNQVFVTTSTFGSGSVYAMNANTGSILWQHDLNAHAGALAGPLYANNSLYVAAFDGTLFKLNPATGAVIWQNRHVLPESYLDSVWSSPIKINNGVKDLILVGVNPNDEFPGVPAPGVGRLIAFNDADGSIEWASPTAISGEGGAGIWELTPSFSSQHNLIFVTTGQTTINNNPGAPVGSNAVIAINATNGHQVWKNQVRSTDIWEFSIPFNPKDPVDTDIGDGAALFTVDGKEYVAMGSKRGYFYVMDALTGDIVNASGHDGIYKRGLDAFNYSGDYGNDVVGNSLDGGYNLDSGYFKTKNGKVIHFATLFDYKNNMKDVNQCVIPGFGVPGDPCPLIDKGHLKLIEVKNNLNTLEVGSYKQDAAHMYAPLYLDDMIFASVTPNESSDPAIQLSNQLVVIDVRNLVQPERLIDNVDVECNGIKAISGGSTFSIGNGMIYMGNGFFGFGPQQGLFAIGLKGASPNSSCN